MGANYGSSDISNCYSTGTVSGGGESIGGLVGENGGTISTCYSTGTITGGEGGYWLGGLVGYNTSGTISDCYSTGPVSSGDNAICHGGLVGINYGGSISNCYSTGIVTVVGDYVDGLVGWNEEGGTISNCYFLTGSGPADGNGMPLTDGQMKQQASFVGWDFDTIWIICEGISYPKFAYQHIPDIVLPLPNAVLAGKVTLTAGANAAGEITGIKFYLREPNSGDGKPIGYENLPADFNGTSGKWEYELDTSRVSDGNYVILAKATDECNNIGFSELVPVTVSNKPTVPNVVGKTEADANTAIVSANLVVGTVTTAYSNTVVAGNVISQKPAAGTVVATGSKVSYVESLGKPIVPNVVGKTAAKANAAIKSVDNLKVGTVTTAYSNTVAKGVVISQDPNAGTEVAIGSKVNYVKSLGKPIVPNIVGKTAADANTAIINANLVVGTVTTAYSKTVAAGKVISQKPAAGKKVAVGSSVNYVESLGKSTTVTVPNLVGKTADDAYAAIINANLVVGTMTTAYSDTVAAGNVISQNPAAGTVVATGSAVSYVESLGKSTTVTVPNLVGKTADDAYAAIVDANLVVGTMTTAYSDTVAAGNVISQNPAAGTEVATGSVVSYVESLGKPIS